MSDLTYNASEVDGLLKASTEVTAQLMAQLCEKEEEIAQLKQAQQKSSDEVIRLEKVASEKVASKVTDINEASVARLVDKLVTNSFLDPRERDKLASELINDPNNIVKLASRIVSISSGAPEQGRGVVKSASNGFPIETAPLNWEEDGWDKVVAI